MLTENLLDAQQKRACLLEPRYVDSNLDIANLTLTLKTTYSVSSPEKM